MLRNTNWSSLQQEKTLPVLLQRVRERLQRCGVWPLIIWDVKPARNVPQVQRFQYWPFFPPFLIDGVEWNDLVLLQKTPHRSLTKGCRRCYEGYKPPVRDHWTQTHHCPFGLCSSSECPLYSYCHDVLRALVGRAFSGGSDIVTRQLFWAVQKGIHLINISNLAQICHWQKNAAGGLETQRLLLCLWCGKASFYTRITVLV